MEPGGHDERPDTDQGVERLSLPHGRRVERARNGTREKDEDEDGGERRED
jgi:hypothetical protein